ncbi:MAG: dipeptidase [Lachnospiraceae bacterium]|nr:dipeptidase [Lachnospiraceae bacterium]
MPIIDMHCDTIAMILNKEWDAVRKLRGKDTVEQVPLRENLLHIDLLRMKKAGYMCQCFAMFTGMDMIPKLGISAFDYVNRLNDTWDREILANADLIKPALTGTEIEENYKAGFMSALKTVEEGAVYEGSIDKMKALYAKGIRMSTLTWNFENELAYPNYFKWETKDGALHCSAEEGMPSPMNKDIVRIWTEADQDRKLKEKGREMVLAMEEMGVVLDVSHLNDAGILDILDLVQKDTPVIASHSNARAITGHCRNLTDEMLRKIADHGGISGINFAADFLNERGDNLSTAEDMIEHMKYIRNISGTDCIGLGTDFDGIDNKVEFGGCEGMPKLADAMKKAGFTEDEIDKVFYKNALRVFKKTLG